MDHSHQQSEILATYFFLPEMFIYLLIKVINKFFLKFLIMRVSVVESRAADLKAISLPSRVQNIFPLFHILFAHLSEIQLTGRSCHKDI